MGNATARCRSHLDMLRYWCQYTHNHAPWEAGPHPVLQWIVVASNVLQAAGVRVAPSFEQGLGG